MNRFRADVNPMAYVNPTAHIDIPGAAMSQLPPWMHREGVAILGTYETMLNRDMVAQRLDIMEDSIDGIMRSLEALKHETVVMRAALQASRLAVVNIRAVPPAAAWDPLTPAAGDPLTPPPGAPSAAAPPAAATHAAAPPAAAPRKRLPRAANHRSRSRPRSRRTMSPRG